MKRIELNINNNKIVCLKKICHNSKLNTFIILPGATTVDLDYVFLALFLKNAEVIIINNPAHGKSQGKPLTDAEDLINFHVQVVKELIKQNHCTKKVNLIGYSLGGMSLLNILNNNLLGDMIDYAVILCAYLTARPGTGEKLENLYNEDTKIFDIKEMQNRARTKVSPFYLRYLPVRKLAACGIACLSDFKLGESMEELAEEKPLRKGINTKTICIIGQQDYFFDENIVPNLKEYFFNFALINVENGHLLPLEAPRKTAQLILNTILSASSFSV